MTAVETAGSAKVMEVDELGEDVQLAPVKHNEQAMGALEVVQTREIEQNVQAAEKKKSLKARKVMEGHSAVKAAMAGIEAGVAAEKVREACHQKPVPKGSTGKMSSLKTTNGGGQIRGEPKRVRLSLA